MKRYDRQVTLLTLLFGFFLAFSPTMAQDKPAEEKKADEKKATEKKTNEKKPVVRKSLDAQLPIVERINVSTAIDTTVIAEALNAEVNSPFVETGPMLTKDGKRLYFSRQGDPANLGGASDQDIWYSTFDDATQLWLPAVNVGAPLNNKGPNFLCGVGWKGDTVLCGNVYLKNGKMKAGISVSIRVGDVWSFPVPVFLNNDYNFANKVDYDLSHDRKALVISQQKDDSNGGTDLYVAFRDETAKETYAGTESINLGPIINSPGNESAPFLSYDGKTLFFSSDGHKGYGGEDIFMSKRLDNTWKKWSKPENMGPGINTKFDDSHFGFTPTSRFAHYSRGLSATNSDVYRVEMTYLFKDVGGMLTASETGLAEIGQTHVVKGVFNDDKDAINGEKVNELEQVLKYLKKNPTMTVLVSAHSNLHSSRDQSFALSDKRLAAIRDYFEKNGIDKSRMNFQSYGQDIFVNSKNPKIKKDIPASVEFKFVNYGR